MGWLERFLRYRRRSLRFTSLGTRFVWVALAVGLAAINTGNNLLYLILALLLSLISLSGILSEQCLRGLAVTRRLAPTIFAAEPTTVTVTVTNRKRLFPSFLLHVSEGTAAGEPAAIRSVAHAEPIFVLPPGASRSITYRVSFERRGRYRLTDIAAVTKFPFGLFAKQLLMPAPAELVVFPSLLPNETLTGQIGPLGQEFTRARRGHGSGFFLLRDYRDGDDARTIHWKSSARQSRLMVKEADEEEHREALLVIDRQWPSASATAYETALFSARFERAVSLAATLILEWSRRGWRLGLCAEGLWLPAAHGQRHVVRLLEALALLPPIAVPEPAARERVEAYPELAVGPGAHQLCIVMQIWDDAAMPWDGAPPNVQRRLVTCPNEPSSLDAREE